MLDLLILSAVVITIFIVVIDSDTACDPFDYCLNDDRHTDQALKSKQHDDSLSSIDSKLKD